MTNMHLSGQTLLASHAGDMGLDRYDIAFFCAMYDTSGLYHSTCRFMAYSIRYSLNSRLSPMIPFINMDISAAKTRSIDFNQNFIRFYIGDRNLLNFSSPFAPGFTERHHCLSHEN